MKIVRSIVKMQSLALCLKKKGKCIGFVPTMGALHEGHLSLIKKARQENDIVVVSIFVNPIQFGPKEDFKKYPRNLKKDSALCRKAEVDILFYPGYKQVYPDGHKTYIEVEGLSQLLCGESRPGHFKGVATVVSKLFNIVQPDNAYFGQKDAQQAIVIQKMVRDLNIPLNVKVLPTLREKDGLAMSSRNAYLSSSERRDAAVLYRALKKARALIKGGKKLSSGIIKEIQRLINYKTSAKIDYIAVVDLNTLEPVKIIKSKALIALAVRLGRTRLIDNIIVG